VTNQILHQEQAFMVHQENERKIAAAELRRLAKAARHADGSSDRADRVVAARLPHMSAIGRVAGAWRSLGRGLVVVVGRRAPA
jgi:hypothetical protein